MRTFVIVAKNMVRSKEARAMAEEASFIHDGRNPDFAISLGGDGTYLESEREWPGVPKLLVRDSLICAKCHDEPLSQMLRLVRDGDIRIVETPKLAASFGGGRIVAVNDIVIRNADPRRALRFRLSVDGVPIGETLIGDGVVAATPFGSSGYYHSVTRETIFEGFGLGFNNLTRPRNPIHWDAESQIQVDIERTDAHLSGDNHPELHILQPRQGVVVSVSEQQARRIGHT